MAKFPFIQTLVEYSKLLVDCKYDLTFLNIILNNIIRNLITEETGSRYETTVHQFATCLYILGGCTAYEFVRLNIPALLPSARVIQAHTDASDNHLSEGLFDYDGIRNYFNMNRSTLGFVAEDATAVVSKVTYDTKSNTFIGFSLPLDSNGLAIPNSYSTDSFIRLEEWYSHVAKSTLLNALLFNHFHLHLTSYLIFLQVTVLIINLDHQMLFPDGTKFIKSAKLKVYVFLVFQLIVIVAIFIRCDYPLDFLLILLMMITQIYYPSIFRIFGVGSTCNRNNFICVSRMQFIFARNYVIDFYLKQHI